MLVQSICSNRRSYSAVSCREIQWLIARISYVYVINPVSGSSDVNGGPSRLESTQTVAYRCLDNAHGHSSCQPCTIMDNAITIKDSTWLHAPYALMYLRREAHRCSRLSATPSSLDRNALLNWRCLVEPARRQTPGACHGGRLSNHRHAHATSVLPQSRLDCSCKHQNTRVHTTGAECPHYTRWYS